jgi:hypothetical protein
MALVRAQVANCPSIPGFAAQQRAKKPLIQNTHCSAYVRVTPDLQELYAGTQLCHRLRLALRAD